MERRKVKTRANDEEEIFLLWSVTESPDASPQRMRTRNKAAKEQTNNRARPKRGGTETPEPKTPSKQNTNSPAEKVSNAPNTPAKKKGKIEKQETPSKSSRKRAQEKIDDAEIEEKDLGLFKKKRERAEVCFVFIFRIAAIVSIVTYCFIVSLRVLLVLQPIRAR